MSKDYQYHVEEKSLTQGFLIRFLWNPIVGEIPAHVTPNTITICGALSMLSSTYFIWITTQGHYWGFLAAAAVVFLYMTADNIDGIHARNTGQSSKLGEFLDHWFDSINTIVINFCLVICLHLQGWLLVAFITSLTIAFFATIWEHHHTGIFQSGRLGTNEGLLLIISLYILLFFAHDASWLIYKPGTINLALVLASFSTFVCILTTCGALRRVGKNFLAYFPIALSLFAIIVVATLGCLESHWRLTAMLMLGTNAVFSGPLMIERLAKKSSPWRKWIISILSIVAITTVFVEFPANFSEKYLIYALGGIFVLCSGWDLLRAVKHLR